MNVQEILSSIVYHDEASKGKNDIGNFQEVFSDFEGLPVKTSKNGARRASIMLKNKQTGLVAKNPVCMSPALTDLFRSDKVTMEHIAGFPVFHGDKGFFVGLPGQGWTDIKSIKVAEYKPTVVSAQDVADFS